METSSNNHENHTGTGETATASLPRDGMLAAMHASLHTMQVAAGPYLQTADRRFAFLSCSITFLYTVMQSLRDFLLLLSHSRPAGLPAPRFLGVVAAGFAGWMVCQPSAAQTGVDSTPAPATGPAISATAPAVDPVQRRKELTEALAQAEAAERRLAQRAEQLNAEMARVLNSAETKALLAPQSATAAVPSQESPRGQIQESIQEPPLRLRMDHGLARLPDATGTLDTPGLPPAGLLGATLLGTAAAGWLLAWSRSMRTTHTGDRNRQKALLVDEQLNEAAGKAPALPFHQH
jgi:hypothetical protein